MQDLTNPRSDRVKLVRRLSGRSSRLRYRQFLVEGPQNVREIVLTSPELVRDVYITQEATDRFDDIVRGAQRNGIYLHTASNEVLAAMSADAQGIVAVADFVPTGQEVLRATLPTARTIAVLSHVRDPGNAGTVIRAADAAGADLVVLTRESVDLFNPKVVRSTAGSLFHVPIVTGVDLEQISLQLRLAEVPLLATTAAGDYNLDDLVDQATGGSSTSEVPLLKGPHAWLFGNEAQGLSESDLAYADASVRIPLHGRAESLNLAMAATICLYASARTHRSTAATP